MGSRNLQDFNGHEYISLNHEHSLLLEQQKRGCEATGIFGYGIQIPLGRLGRAVASRWCLGYRRHIVLRGKSSEAQEIPFDTSKLPVRPVGI